MIDESKFPEYREKVFHYIQEEILPKYPEIKSCGMHILPKILDKDVEYIFTLESQLCKKEVGNLYANIFEEIYYFCSSFNLEFIFKILVILF